MTAHGPERRGPERPGPDYPAEWDREREEGVMDGQRDDERERVARAFYDKKAAPGHPWSTVSEDVRAGWLRYADRQLAVVLPALAARPSADTETLRARIVAARGTHDCPVCNAGRPIPDDVTCPLCDGWTTL